MKTRPQRAAPASKKQTRGGGGGKADDPAVRPAEARRILRSPKMAEVVAGDIRDSIIAGRLKEGDRLPQELEMIARYGVSRGVMREALRLLEAESFVQVQRGARGGAVITRRNDDTVARATLLTMQVHDTRLGDLYEANKVIVPAAARFAAASRPVEAAAALQAHLDYQRATRGSQEESLAQALSDFHFTVIEHCGNRTLQIVGQSMHRIMQSQLVRLHWLFKPGVGSAAYEKFIDNAMAASERLIGLIAAGEGRRAEQHWAKHMERAGERFFAVVDPDLSLQ